MELTEESLARSHFSPENPTIIVAHGWNSNGRWRGYGASLADDYLAEGDYNVFSVDWGDLESWANYPHAAAITRPVGEFAAELGRENYFSMSCEGVKYKDKEFNYDNTTTLRI